MSSGLLRAVRRSAPLLVMSAILPAGIVLVQAGSPSPVYTSTASVYIATTASGDTRALDAGAIFTQRQMSSYAALAKSNEVLDPVIAELATGETAARMARRLTVTVTSPGHLINVSSSSGSVGPSTTLVTAVARSLSDRVVADSPQDSRGRPTVIAEHLGASSSEVNSHRPWLLGILAGMAGMAVAGSLILYRYASVDLIATIDDLNEVTTAKVLAEFRPIGHRPHGSQGPSPAHEMERLAVAVRAVADGGAVLLAETTLDQTTARIARGLIDELSTAGVESDLIEPASSWSFHAHNGVGSIDLPTPRAVQAYVSGQRSAGHLTAIIRPPSRAHVAPVLGATHGIVMVTLGRTSSAALVSALRYLEANQIRVVGLVVTGAPRLRSRFGALGSAPAGPRPGLDLARNSSTGRMER